MWYDEALGYIVETTVVLAGASWVLTHDRKGRALPLIFLALGIGVWFGISVTARGWFKLPLGPMQKQMHEVWDIPNERLQPPR